MITVPESTLYEMTMFDTSAYSSDPRPSLDKIATKVYGKKYVGQQTGDMIGNDSWHVYDMSTENKCLDWIPVYIEEECYKGERGEEYYYSVPAWLKRDTSNDNYDFQDYRTAPSPECMLATLILEGHLPYGRYLIEVSW